MEHEHDPNKPGEMCDEHLRQHGATIVAELLNRDLLVIGSPKHSSVCVICCAAVDLLPSANAVSSIITNLHLPPYNMSNSPLRFP